MVRITNHKTRENEILAAIINNYIKSASPISSQELSQSFDYSSATIRNVMSDLEDLGLITHTYTSSGRIPTDKGWRFYIDNLLSEIELLSEEKEKIEDEYKNSIKELEALLDKTTDLLSARTHCTSIASAIDLEDKIFYKGVVFIFEQPEFQDLNKIKELFTMMEEKQRLISILNRDLEEKVDVYVGTEISCAEMDNCSLVVSSYDMNNRPSGRIGILGPKRMNYPKIIPTLTFVSETLNKALSQI